MSRDAGIWSSWYFFLSGFGRCGAGSEPEAVVTGFEDVTMMGQPIEQRGGHLGIAEHIRPFAEAEVGGNDDAGPLVEFAQRRAPTGRRPDRGFGGSSNLPMLRRHHGHHRGFRAPLSRPRAAIPGAILREPSVVIRHGLSPTPSRADPRLEAASLALALLISGRRNSKIGPSAFARPLSRPKSRQSVLRCVRFWEATAGPTTCSKPLSS